MKIQILYWILCDGSIANFIIQQNDIIYNLDYLFCRGIVTCIYACVAGFFNSLFSPVQFPKKRHRISDLVVFLIAGHETTAHTMSFFLYCLAKYPETQLKLQKELDEVHPTGPSFTTESRSQSRSLFCLSDVANLEYFSHCLKESQR